MFCSVESKMTIDMRVYMQILNATIMTGPKFNVETKIQTRHEPQSENLWTEKLRHTLENNTNLSAGMMINAHFSTH